MPSIARAPRRATNVAKKASVSRPSRKTALKRPAVVARAQRGILAHVLEDEVRATVAAHTGRRIRVHFMGDQAFTTGKIIVLPALPRIRLIPYRNAMQIRGYTHHERLHIEESDFEAITPFLAQFASNPMLKHLAQRFHNAIEDVRIERIGTAKFAGVKAALDFMAARLNEMSADSLNASPERLAVPAFVGPVAITWIGRKLMQYPTPSNDTCLAMLPAPVRQCVDQWAADVMSVRTTDDAFDLAKKLAEQTFKDLPPQQQQADPQDNQPGTEASDNSQSGDQSPERSNTKNDPKNKKPNQQPQPGQQPSSPPADGPKPERQPACALPVEPSLVPTFADMGIEIKASPDGIPIVVSITSKPNDPRGSIALCVDGGEPAMVVGPGGGYSPGNIQSVTIHAPATQSARHRFILPRLPRSGSKQYDYRVITTGENAENMAAAEGRQEYLAIKREIASTTANAIMALRRSLMAKLQARWRGNREDGLLDSRRLADVLTGSTTVYKQRIAAPRLDTAVTLLIDNSGSMTDHLRLCQELGIVLTETFRGTPVKSELIGFTTGDGAAHTAEDRAKLDVAKKLSTGWVHHDSLSLYLFKGYDDSPAASEIPIGNMTRVTLGGTPTAPSILAVVPRLYARPEQRKVLIVITDGLSDHDEIKAALQLLDQLGIAVVAIGIRCKEVHKSFRHAIVLNDVADLSGTILKQLGDMLADGQ